MMELTHQATAYYPKSTHGEQATAQANFDALHNGSKPCRDGNYRRFCRCLLSLSQSSGKSCSQGVRPLYDWRDDMAACY